VVVVDHNLDDFTMLNYEWVDLTVHLGIRGKLSSDCVRSVESGNILGDVSFVVHGKARHSVDLGGESVDDDLVLNGLE